MNAGELEIKWKSIVFGGAAQYRSLRISADSFPELYLALDVKGNRYLILQVPDKTAVDCSTIEKENLSLEWFEEKRFILIGLRSIRFLDLFNDLTLSLYNRIKDIQSPEHYSREFIHVFHKWAEFFEDGSSGLLPESDLKGLFGELIVLRWYLANDQQLSVNQILDAWQGPFNRAQDFIFPALNLEVKTKNTDEMNIRISSEFQLEEEPGKGLNLVIVNLNKQEDGLTLRALIADIRELIMLKAGDLSVFMKLLARAGVKAADPEKYDEFIWEISNLSFYNCTDLQFPRITTSTIMDGISQVGYRLNMRVLETFLINKFTP
ncbi:MAG: PD-(D/E)XK motif protein [Puia sp.]|nr:PD-(D/E)XK motif protein [Puia sp.]